MCFTVEIDDKHFPNVYDFISNLDKSNIIYMSNEFDACSCGNGYHCYRFEFDLLYISKVSAMLAELIKNDYLKKYADNIIETNYCGIYNIDKEELITSVIEYSDKYKLTDILHDFIQNNKHIHLSGFALFRLKSYLSDFENEIDFAVDEYIEQQRYKDFVRFLKFFVDMQDSSFEEINLLINKKGDYKILDEKGVPVSTALLDSTYCEIGALDEDDEYIMLNDLISLAPKHITIHCPKLYEGEETVKIIKEIFNNRVKVCNNCYMCN